MVAPLAGFLAKRAVEFIGGHLMGLGYTSGAYTGYGVSNTLDPLGIHDRQTYRQPRKLSFEMPYGSYGRRRYRYGSRRRYSRYTRYRRRRYRYRRYSRFY